MVVSYIDTGIDEIATTFASCYSYKSLTEVIERRTLRCESSRDSSDVSSKTMSTSNSVSSRRKQAKPQRLPNDTELLAPPLANARLVVFLGGEVCCNQYILLRRQHQKGVTLSAKAKSIVCRAVGLCGLSVVCPSNQQAAGLLA
ncbi:hypothetical protein Tcan_06549 [Toxocara canis]|uniref:Uncharacterized protein n=1 Tax=Toxocara canis TaxID=6265 RepID=A0A0B2V553_TOXCA|nr:hypothetical protein Tcan_06549 [Toxocara canis]